VAERDSRGVTAKIDRPNHVHWPINVSLPRQQLDAEGDPAKTPCSDASGTVSRALSVTTDVQAGGAEQEAAQLIASHMQDALPRLIALLGNSDLFTLVRRLKQLTSR
jgi:hypothetical protein